MKMSEMSKENINILNKEYENPWKGTCLENYFLLSPAAKGALGEKFVSKILKENCFSVLNGINSGHDRIVNGKKAEIKFAIASNKNNFWYCIFNHISWSKDWEVIYFCCINGDESIRLVSFTKEELPLDLFQHQQGGKNNNNDDYFCQGEKTSMLLMHPDANRIIGEF